MKTLQSQLMFNIVPFIDSASCDKIIRQCEERKRQIIIQAENQIKAKISYVLGIDLQIGDLYLSHGSAYQSLIFTNYGRKYCFQSNFMSFIEDKTTTQVFCKDGNWLQQKTHYEKCQTNDDKPYVDPVEPITDPTIIHMAKLSSHVDELHKLHLESLGSKD